MEIEAVDSCYVIISMLLMFFVVVWSWLACKVPLKFWDPKVSQTHRMTIFYLYCHLLFSAPGCFLPIIKVFLPRRVLSWAIVDFVTGASFIIARYVVRIFFSTQLRTILDKIVPKMTLNACMIVSYIFMVSQSIILSWDFVEQKYGTLDVILANGIVADSVRLLDFQISISVTIIIIIETLVLDTFQLYLFYQGTKLLRHDADRKKAISIVLLSFILSATSVLLSGVGPFINIRNSSSYFAILYYPIEPCVIVMPFIVKRYKSLDGLVKWIVAAIDKQNLKQVNTKSTNFESAVKSSTHFIASATQ